MASVQLGGRIATVYELQTAWLEPRLQAHGLSWSTFQLLTTVSALGEGASQIEVARALGVTPATLSESVQGHIRKGLIQQVPSSTDRRIKVLELTPLALQKLEIVKRVAAEGEEIMVKGISKRDLEICCRVLDQASLRLQAAVDSDPTD